MTPLLCGLPPYCQKKKKQNIHAFNNVRKCIVYRNENESHEYNMTSLKLSLLRIQIVLAHYF